MNHRSWLILFWAWASCLSTQAHPTAADEPTAPCIRTGLPAGTVLVSRNANERDNTAPGYWNHLAICAGDVVIESQAGAGVLATPVSLFLARPYAQITALRPLSPTLGQKAAHRALSLVGTPYAQWSSVFHQLGGNGPTRLSLGLNCVSVVEECYRLPGVNRPDRVFDYSRGRCPVFTSPEVVR